MREGITKLLIRLMKEHLAELEAGSSSLTEEEQADILDFLTHRAISKEEACKMVHVKRSRFEALIRAGKLPKGRKRKYSREHYWLKDEIQRALEGGSGRIINP